MNALSEVQIENSRLRLHFDAPTRSKPIPLMRLLDKRTEHRLEAPLVEMEMLWSPIQRVELQKDVSLTAARKLSDAEAEFVFFANWSRIEFALRLRLEGNEFTVTVLWRSIREHRQDFFRLFGVRPLPGLMRAGAGATLLAPVRCGGLIHPSRHPNVHDRLLIYGEQSRWEDLPLLPACALFDGKRRGLAIIAERGDCDVQYELDIDANGVGTAGFSCRYRYLWPDPVDPVDRVLRYVLLDENDADYSGVGRRMSRFVAEAHGMLSLKEKAERSPHVAYVAGALTMKTFHAMKELGHERGDGPYHVFQTFAETKGQLRKLKDAGVEKANIQHVGWNLDGHDGKYPNRFPVDPRLGGEEGFKELVRYGQSLGYMMQVHDNYADTHFPDSPTCIRQLWGDALPRGIWGGGAIYSVNPLKLDEADAKKDMLKLRDLGVAGLYYLDAMGPPLEVDYDPKHGGPRSFQARGLAWILGVGREVFGACGTENGFAYVATHSDYIGDTPLRTIWEGHKRDTSILGAVDEWVPVWQITFTGRLVHTRSDEPSPTTVKLLEAAEIGGAPRSDFSGATPDPKGELFAIQWDDRLLPSYRAKYDILCRKLGHTRFAFIERHTNLGGDCYQTEFSNGCVVRVDYPRKKLFVDGAEVPIPPVFDLRLPMRRA